MVAVDLAACERRLAVALAAFPEVAAAYVFGSTLGGCRPDSDVDVALVVGWAVQDDPGFSPWGLEGRAEAAIASLGGMGGHPWHVTVLDSRRPVFAMEALGGRLAYCADETVLADFIEFVARRFPDAERRWRQAVADVLAAAPERR